MLISNFASSSVEISVIHPLVKRSEAYSSSVMHMPLCFYGFGLRGPSPRRGWLKLLKVQCFTMILTKKNPCVSAVIILISNGIKSSGEKNANKPLNLNFRELVKYLVECFICLKFILHIIWHECIALPVKPFMC